MRASQQGASAAPTTDRTCTSTISQSVGVRRSPVDATECQHRASTEHSAPHARSGDARGDARSGDARKCALRELRSNVDTVIAWCSSGARTAPEMRARTHTHGARARASSGARGARHLVVQLRSSWSSSSRGAAPELVEPGAARAHLGAGPVHRPRSKDSPGPRLLADPGRTLVFVLCLCLGRGLLGFGQYLMFGKNGMRLATMDSTNVRNVTRQKISRDFVFWNEVS